MQRLLSNVSPRFSQRLNQAGNNTHLRLYAAPDNPRLFLHVNLSSFLGKGTRIFGFRNTPIFSVLV